jgi:hypothetical protein
MRFVSYFKENSPKKAEAAERETQLPLVRLSRGAGQPKIQRLSYVRRRSGQLRALKSRAWAFFSFLLVSRWAV